MNYEFRDALCVHKKTKIFLGFPYQVTDFMKQVNVFEEFPLNLLAVSSHVKSVSF